MLVMDLSLTRVIYSTHLAYSRVVSQIGGAVPCKYVYEHAKDDHYLTFKI